MAVAGITHQTIASWFEAAGVPIGDTDAATEARLERIFQQIIHGERTVDGIKASIGAIAAGQTSNEGAAKQTFAPAPVFQMPWNSGTATITETGPTVTPTPPDTSPANVALQTEQAAIVAADDERARLAVQEEEARKNRRAFGEQAASLYPWMTQGLIGVFTGAYVDHGDTQLAVQEVRNGKGKAEYDTIFKGNRRADGTLRMSENEYFGVVNSYRNEFSNRGMNADVFEEKWASLIEGDVSANEFASRMAAVEQDIVLQGDLLIENFTRMWGVEATAEAAFAAIVDPTIGDAILRRDISVAQVQSEANRFGMSRSVDRGRELVALGVDQQQARGFFSSAGRSVSSLNSAAQRFGAADNSVDLNELENAIFALDPTQQQRIQSLLSQQQGEFSRSATLGNQRGRLGGLSPS